MTRQRALERDEPLARLCPIVREALREVGHYQTRNRGTIGGSLAHLDPAAELPGIMALYDAQLEVQSSSGKKTIAMADWAQGYMTPNLGPDELLTGVSWEAWEGPHGHAFVEFARRRGDFAIVGVGCLVSLNEDKTVKRAAISIVGAGYTPIRLVNAEKVLAGRPLDVEAAAAEARRIEAKADVHASAAYRQRLAAVLTARALKLAFERTTNG